jgi:hypothetical protein
VAAFTADPECSEDATAPDSDNNGRGLMNEFFHQVTVQPGISPVETVATRKTMRE